MPIPLKVNCGYARTAILELTSLSKGRHGRACDTTIRATKFKELFTSNHLPQGWYEPNGSPAKTFNTNCAAILTTFGKKWYPATRRLEYEATFCITQWKQLTDEDRRKHTVSNCNACSAGYPLLQEAFPGGPLHVAPKTSLVCLPEQQGCSRKAESVECRKVMSELNQEWCKRYDHSLTSTLPAIFPEGNLTHKKSKTEKKKDDRTRKRKVASFITARISENATITMLAEAESQASYNRKRHAMSFELPTSPPKKVKLHSPCENSHTWSHEDATALLQGHPTGQAINWSASARTLGIPGRNAGQVLKEFAVKRGMDVATLECRCTPATPRIRRRKKKLPGGEMSVPTLPTLTEIATEKRHLIETGELSIGEPCSPYTITKSVVTAQGNVETRKVQICGRKVPLLDLRKGLLQKHEKYMRLNTDCEIASLDREHLFEIAGTIHHDFPDSASMLTLQSDLAKLQRTRTLPTWHDHSTILQTGYILFAIWVVYDPAVYLTEREYTRKTGLPVQNLQAIIEEPTIYMIAPSSSSPTDQLALVPDRVECLKELSQQVVASNGIAITDKMRFFCGDKPAQQFERGTQIGGTYKCGGCGCKDTMMHDLAHALHCKLRSVADLQALILKGKYGNSPGSLKPLNGLRVEQLRQELETRGQCTSDKLKPELLEELSCILKGAQRVPTLLVCNPTQSLDSLNLSQYEILDCEPLHDLKGHISHILEEIPHLLSPPLRLECTSIIETTVPKQKVSGVLLRVALLKVFLKLTNHALPDVNEIRMLVQTAVKMSELLYSTHSHRTPKSVLQLYNCSWLHHELCCELIGDPKEQTLQRLFGVYLHSLVVHAPPQYELVCLRSTNSESQERLFSQTKHISLRATNRRPDNVLPTILLSMQAKQKTQKPLECL